MVEKAIRTVNGKENGYFIRNEIEIKPIFDGMGWAEYVTKNTENTPKYLPDFRLITCTNKASQLAKKLYESDRELVIKVKRPKHCLINDYQ